MTKLYNMPGTGEASDFSFDDIHYELTNDDWQSQDTRQQNRDWSIARGATSRVRRATTRRK